MVNCQLLTVNGWITLQVNAYTFNQLTKILKCGIFQPKLGKQADRGISLYQLFYLLTDLITEVLGGVGVKKDSCVLAGYGGS